MMTTLTEANVVVVASAFNVPIFNTHWLVTKGIFSAEEITPEKCLLLPVAAQVETPACHLLVMPERLQLTIKTRPPEPALLRKVELVIESLPETPYRALGLNFTWDLAAADGQDIGAFTRASFAASDRALTGRFAGPDARFGAYLSEDFGGFRMRLDIKPITVNSPSGSSESVRFSFNFHLDIRSGEGTVEALRGGISKWSEAFAEAQRVMDLYA